MTPVQFATINGHRRSVYRQLDGSIELADACKCVGGKWVMDCPIDEHKIRARNEAVKETVNFVQASE